ncbi:MAG: hypothetical protein JJ900_08575 [Rhodospirillales bacterium]|nr:hypothetical protein [Rhodospirillales bacterium]MBO6786892.1 hypothetical protein [Rhodospirillales bacterium]
MYSRLAAALILAVLAGTAAASDDIGDLSSAVAAAGHDVPAPDVLRKACDRDALCVARFLKDRIGDGAAIVPVEPENGKSTGWSRPPPVRIVTLGADGRLIIVLRRFDTRAVANAVLGAGKEDETKVSRIVLDLRQMEGDGNLDNMRRVASLFIGERARAFQLRHATGRVVDWTVPKPMLNLARTPTEVWVDGDVDADAELFAAILRKYAGAKVLGEITRARGYRLETVPVTHGWALQIPTGRLSVPGEDLTGGLIPDGPVPE